MDRPVSNLESFDSSPSVLNFKEAFHQVVCKNTFVSLPLSTANFEVDSGKFKSYCDWKFMELKFSIYYLQELGTTWLHLLKVLTQIRISSHTHIELTLIYSPVCELNDFNETSLICLLIDPEGVCLIGS